MDVSFSDEQEMLAETVGSLAQRIGPSAPHDLDGATENDAGSWKLLADAGLLGLRVPESAGGSGTSGVEPMIVAEKLARSVCAVPFIGQGVLAPQLLAAAGANGELLAGIATGERRVTVALDPTLVRLARAGEPAVAWDCAGAEAALALDANGGLAAVTVEGRALRPTDLTRAVTKLDNPPAADLGDLGGHLGDDPLQRWEALALTMLSADLVGAMDGTLTTAVEYAKERVQFETVIGSFQAVQHLCAEAYVLLEGSRSATWYPAWAVDRLSPADALLAARTAKAHSSEAGQQVGETSIQVHGGVAITWEYMPHVFLRRILLDRQTLGDENHQLRAIADIRLRGAA
ncbi:MAG TPA: acyl-CoA dehydrogenase family protein [Acidimicrobiales bacterium]|nr:acyl-CoA dehydrogenase family protein [Acidimicrobiales bacterium]